MATWKSDANQISWIEVFPEHDPEKWIPRDKRKAFARRSCSNKKMERDDDSKKSHHAPGKLKRSEHAHRYDIRHHCSPLSGDAGFRAGTRSALAIPRSALAIRGTDSPVQHGHTEHTGRRRQGSATGGALESR